MPLFGALSRLPPHFDTLKFKIVAMAVLTAVVAAFASTQLAVTATRADLEHLLLSNERDDGERMAAVLASKLETLVSALKMLAGSIGPEQMELPAAIQAKLRGNPGMSVLFENVYVARSDGSLLARMERGEPATTLPNIADRAYFRLAMRGDQPVVSDPLVGRVSDRPAVAIAVPVAATAGKNVGIVGGSLSLRSTSLFANLSSASDPDGARTLVMDRAGTVLTHPDVSRLLGSAADEPGLAEVFERWHASGSPIDTRSVAVLTGTHMVSMTGIPLSNWVLVHIAPQAAAMAPLAAVQRTAWRSAAVVGVVAAALSGLLAWHLTRPISRLRLRAQRMLGDDTSEVDDWPRERGEVGKLAETFQRVVEQRQARQRETQSLLHQLEAVLDHAEVGIALTQDRRFKFVSCKFCFILDHSAEQLIGEATRMIHVSESAYEAISQTAETALLECGSFDAEVELARRDGESFWARVRGRAVTADDRSQGTIWTVEDVTDARERRERLTWASNHDSLTGLANRAAFEELLDRASARSETQPFCALFIDLDRFKQVNDTSGHAAGDALLRGIAQVLMAHVRKSDTVARIGGDEFAVLLDRCPVVQAQAVAEKIRTAVVEYALPWNGCTHSVGASIGLVLVDGALNNASEVLSAADAACYAAKRHGRNRVELHAEA